GHLTVDTIILDREQKKKDSVFSLLRGRVMFYAMKLFKYRSAGMTVKTKTAVAGIRGTKFGVEVIPTKEGGPQATAPVYLADASETGWVRLAQAPGTTTEVGSYTVVYSFDGTVTVTSTVTGQSVTLTTGEFVNMFTTGAGEVQPTPEGLSQLFQSGTSAPDGDGGGGDDGDGGGGDGGEGDGEGDGGGGEDGDGDGTGGIGGTDGTTATDVTQQQSTTQTEQSYSGGKRAGYFTGMLTAYCDECGIYHRATYISTTMQTTGFDNAKAMESDGDPDRYVQIENGKVKSWQATGSVVTWSSEEGIDITSTKIGENSYMEWGYWTQPTAMRGSNSINYYFDQRGYYVWGDYTANMPQTGSYTYAGNAYGTIVEDYNTATNMTGDFSTDVNFANETLSNFTLTVTGGDYCASISEASGTMGSSHFELSGGNWKLFKGESVYPADSRKSAYGSFYGPNAEAMGGVWQMGYGGGYYNAVGSFVSTSKTTQEITP
ncbi:MAG: FecR domain-containing protein, partial [Deltaproteobacteria bacterium]|nr:FecR domain-containing protein [Deltaproteobacteria bacterium]